MLKCTLLVYVWICIHASNMRSTFFFYFSFLSLLFSTYDILVYFQLYSRDANTEVAVPGYPLSTRRKETNPVPTIHKSIAFSESEAPNFTISSKQNTKVRPQRNVFSNAMSKRIRNASHHSLGRMCRNAKKCRATGQQLVASYLLVILTPLDSRWQDVVTAHNVAILCSVSRCQSDLSEQ